LLRTGHWPAGDSNLSLFPFSRPSPAFEFKLLAPAIPIRISSSFARQLLPVAITLVVMMDGWSVLLALKADPQSLSFLSDLSLFVPMNWARW
jgi:hypothetical protein